jgi:hypothetical protein
MSALRHEAGAKPKSEEWLRPMLPHLPQRERPVVVGDQSEGLEAVRDQVVDVVRAQVSANPGADELCNRARRRLPVEILGKRIEHRRDLDDLPVATSDEARSLLERRPVELTEELHPVSEFPAATAPAAETLLINPRDNRHRRSSSLK